jgi:beta-glucanase (GH16 family)
MRTLVSSLLLFAFLTACENNRESEKTEWVLVWEDNFDNDGLPDSNIWTYEEGYVRNNENQYYTKNRLENARIESGNLVIEARKDNWEGNEITSASLHTFGKKSILYGKIEVRAKLPSGAGTWPAIWTLGDNVGEIGWPACGEIDIMENVGFNPKVIYANIHTTAYNHRNGTNKGDNISIENPTPYLNFHVYSIEWIEDRIDFFVDKILYFTFKNEKTGNDAWPFDKSQYLILNLAIGGSWGGQQGINNSIFPAKYYIDYLRVYKMKQ